MSSASPLCSHALSTFGQHHAVKSFASYFLLLNNLSSNLFSCINNLFSSSSQTDLGSWIKMSTGSVKCIHSCKFVLGCAFLQLCHRQNFLSVHLPREYPNGTHPWPVMTFQTSWRFKKIDWTTLDIDGQSDRQERQRVSNPMSL